MSVANRPAAPIGFESAALTSAPSDLLGERQGWLRISLFLLLAILLWLPAHPYWGVAHDGLLYTFQGVAHLHPDLYRNDIYLRYGSQDQYTLFSPVYAWVIGLFGIDHAAALMTLLAQIALFASIGLLARKLMPVRYAWLVVGIFAVVSEPYGATGIFHVVEDFVTPRPFAEALVLCGLVAMLSGRDALMFGCFALAFVVHPIMTEAGVMAYVWMRFAVPRPKTAALVVAAAIIGLIIAAYSPLGPSIRYDTDWYTQFTHWLTYLRTSAWVQLDWDRVCLVVAILALEAKVLTDSTHRALAICAIALIVGGITATLIGADWLHIRIIVQAQPWRWQWLSNVIATVLVPLLIERQWSAGRWGRCTIILFTAALLFDDHAACIPIMLMALACSAAAACPTPPLSAEARRLIFFGCIALLVVAMLWAVANAMLAIHNPLFEFASSGTGQWPARIRALDSALPLFAVLLCLAWWLLLVQRHSISLIVLGLVCVAGYVFTAPTTARTWAAIKYPEATFAAFAPWRAQIPVGEEVVYPANPTYAWFFLQRPSYLSSVQLVSTLFSREARAQVMLRLAKYGAFGVDPKTGATEGEELPAQELCRRSGGHYVITRVKSTLPSIGTLPPQVGFPMSSLKLYRCPVS